MSKKLPTNTDKLIALIKENDMNNPILNALLRERIVLIMEMTVKDIEKNPDTWNKGIIHPNLYKGLNNMVQKTIGFDKD